MKTFTIALLLLFPCPAWAGPLMDAAQEASKEPLKVITTPAPKPTSESKIPRTPEEFEARKKAMFREIEMSAMGQTWREWASELEAKAKNEKAFRENFLFSRRQQNVDGFNLQVTADICQKMNQRFQGSNVNCIMGGGTWVAGQMQITFQNWNAVELQDKTEGPITYTVSYPQQVIKYADNNGNHITLKIYGPKRAQVIDARLPDMADASLEVIPPDLKKRAFNLKSNFLIQILNDVYAARWEEKVGMASYAHDILAFPENRELVIQQAGDIYTQPASQNKNKPVKK